MIWSRLQWFNESHLSLVNVSPYFGPRPSHKVTRIRDYIGGCQKFQICIWTILYWKSDLASNLGNWNADMASIFEDKVVDLIN